LLKDYSFRKFAVDGVTYSYYSLKSLEERGLFRLAELPYSIKVLVENVLRSEDGNTVTDEDVESSFSYFGGGRGRYPSTQPACFFRTLQVFRRSLTWLR
jgi:aconitate hydratase